MKMLKNMIKDQKGVVGGVINDIFHHTAKKAHNKLKTNQFKYLIF